MNTDEFAQIRAEALTINNLWDYVTSGSAIRPESWDIINQDPVRIIRTLGGAGLKVSKSDPDSVTRYQKLCISATNYSDDDSSYAVSDSDGVFAYDRTHITTRHSSRTNQSFS